MRPSDVVVPGHGAPPLAAGPDEGRPTAKAEWDGLERLAWWTNRPSDSLGHPSTQQTRGGPGDLAAPERRAALRVRGWSGVGQDRWT